MSAMRAMPWVHDTRMPWLQVACGAVTWSARCCKVFEGSVPQVAKNRVDSTVKVGSGSSAQVSKGEG